MNYRLEDLIDIGLFQELQDRLNEIYSFPSAIIDLEGNILTATAWQDVCTKFHRVHPECERECRMSDQYITGHIHEARPAVTYRCPHGLVDNATPIVIAGEHLGNFFTGQFFLEPPDLEFFRGQAHRFGFDEAAYLDAVRRVPVWSQKKLDQYLDFIKGFTEILAGIGHRQLVELEARREISSQTAALEDANVLRRQIVECVDAGVIVYGPDLRYRLWNPYMERLTGKRADDVLGRHPVDVFPFLDDAGMQNRLRRALAGEPQPPVDVPFDLPGRGTGWATDACAPLRDGSGQIIGVIATVRDVTKRRRAEAALRDSQELLSTVLATSPVGIVMFDAARTPTFANATAERLVGNTLRLVSDRSGDAPGATFRDEQGRTIPAEQLPFAIAARTGKAVTRSRVVVTRADGSDSFLSCSAAPLRDTTGAVTGVVASLEDVTEQHLAENERKRLENNLIEAQKLAAIGTLAGGVAHNFNNILGAMLGLVGLLRLDEPVRPSFKAQIDELERCIEAAAALARQLLGFARGGPYDVRPTDMVEVIDEAVRMLGRTRKDLTIERRHEPGPSSVVGDRSQLGQVILNLLVNAGEAQPRDGRITVTTAHAIVREQEVPGLGAGDYVRVDVRDSGVGMDAETRARVFEPFFTTKPMGRGTGLGLASVYGIVSNHRGAVTVESAPGQGSTFRLWIPACEPATSVPAPRPDTLRRGSETILLVDDEPLVLKSVHGLLAHLGYTVLPATNGRAAVELFRERHAEVALVVLDLVMPDLNGSDTFDRLREIDPRVKVLLSSGYARNDLAEAVIARGAGGFIQKPFGPEALSDQIRELLG